MGAFECGRYQFARFLCPMKATVPMMHIQVFTADMWSGNRNLPQ